MRARALTVTMSGSHFRSDLWSTRYVTWETALTHVCTKVKQLKCMMQSVILNLIKPCISWVFQKYSYVWFPPIYRRFLFSFTCANYLKLCNKCHLDKQKNFRNRSSIKNQVRQTRVYTPKWIILLFSSHINLKCFLNPVQKMQVQPALP